jgi:adenine-specific DNA methylase
VESSKRITPKKKILGDYYFPVKEVSEEAIKEKKGRSSIYHMHFYWGRKPLIAARASILASSLPKGEEDKILEQLGLEKPIRKRKRRAFHQKPDLKYLQNQYKKVYGKSKPLLLDPFAGGGSIIYEGLRLGFDVVACEYNPVAWTLLKGVIEYPKKYGNILLDRIELAFKELIEELHRKIGHLYPKTDNIITSTYMYAWGVTCPYCGKKTPLVNNWILKKKLCRDSAKKRFDWIYMKPSLADDRLEIQIIEEYNVLKPSNLDEGTVIRGKARCISCRNIIQNKYIVEDIKLNKFEFPLILVQIEENKKGKTYVPFDDQNIQIWQSSKHLAKGVETGVLPDFPMPLRIIPAARYLGTWDQLANERQRYLFYNLSKVATKITTEKAKIWGSEWGEITAVYFSFLLGKSVDFNTRCTSWASKEGIRNSLAFRRPSMVWDHCEINPFSPKGSGNLRTVTKNILDGLKQACYDLNDTPGSVNIILGSMMQENLPNADLVVTDPPYADDVQYPELSEFFYAWEQSILLPVFPFLPKGSPPKTEDLSSNNIDRTEEFVQFGMSLAFKKIYQILNPEGRMSLFFAHGRLNVWSFVVNSLIKAGFTITSTFPVHTESRDNVIALGKASFMTSILINSIQRENDSIAYIEEIIDEIKDFAQSTIRSYMNYGFSGSDLSMAAIGPVLKKISEYSEIKSISGTLHLKEVLHITNNILLNQILGSSIISTLDSITKSYLYTRLSGQKIISFDVLQLIAKSLGINSEMLRHSTLFKERRVGKQKTYSLRNYKNREKFGDSLIDQIHKGFQAYEIGGNLAFWDEIEEEKHKVQQVLKLINHGIDRGNLAPEVDPDTHLSQQVCGIAP